MENAELYARACALQQQFSSEVLRQLWSALDWSCVRGGVVLDVGCGPGDFTVSELLSRLPEDVGVIAADRSPVMLAKAVSRYAGPRLSFCHLDIGTHQLEETNVWRLGPYPKVFSFFCLMWVPDQRHVLKNINKLLRTGGEAVLIIVSYCRAHTTYETLGRSLQWGPYMQGYEKIVTPYQHSQDPEGVLRMYLQEEGFIVKTCRNQVDICYTSTQEQDIIDTITAINPFVDKLPEELRETFIRDTMNEAYSNGAILATSTPSGTTYSFRYDALVTHAIKA